MPIPEAAGFEGYLRAGIVAERDLGGAVEGAGAVGSDHDAHLAVDAARGAVRSQPFQIERANGHSRQNLPFPFRRTAPQGEGRTRPTKSSIRMARASEGLRSSA